MIKNILSFLIVIFIAMIASDQQVHQHGLATGSLIIQGSQVVIQLKIPAVDVVGFEYSPQNKKEHEKVQAALDQLKSKRLFDFYTKSRWLNRTKKIKLISIKDDVQFNASSPEKEDASHHDHHTHLKHPHHHSKDHVEKEPEDIHSEFIVERTYSINENVAIYEISTLIFNEVLNLESLDFRIVSSSDQLEIDFNRTKTSDRFSKPILINVQ